jgi:SAM-dependent methyltransferase
VLTGILHSIVSRPAVYELVQRAAGGRQVHRRVAKHVVVPEVPWVLDFGGGTGSLGDMLRGAQGYICLDHDFERLRRFRHNHPTGRALVGDVTGVPIATGAIDTVICAAVSHHLTDEQLGAAVREARRVLRSGGRLVFMDAVWAPRRLGGRLLWRYDQGSHPRTAAALRSFLAGHFDIAEWEELAVVHRYVIAVATPRGEPAGIRAYGI